MSVLRAAAVVVAVAAVIVIGVDAGGCSGFEVAPETADAGDAESVASERGAEAGRPVSPTADPRICIDGTTVGCFCGGSVQGTRTCAVGQYGNCQCPDEATTDGGCAKPCSGGACCGSDQLCVREGRTDVWSCKTKCTTNASCGMSTCCSRLVDIDSGAFTGQSVCNGGRTNDGGCLCATPTDCPAGACTPALGISTCQPNGDGIAYHGCHEATCGGYLDCVSDCRGNRYCAIADATPTNCNLQGGWCISRYLGPAQTPPCYNPGFPLYYDCDRDCMPCSCLP